MLKRPIQRISVFVLPVLAWLLMGSPASAGDLQPDSNKRVSPRPAPYFNPTPSRSTKPWVAFSPLATAGIGGGRTGAIFEIGSTIITDGIRATSLTLGYSDIGGKEFAVGGAFTGAHFISATLGGELLMNNEGLTGIQATGGLGVFIGLIVLRLGYRTDTDRPIVEVGLMAKIPITGFFYD